MNRPFSRYWMNQYPFMITRRFTLFLGAIGIALQLMLFTSCDKFKGEQTIPAYITIDSIYITTDMSTQGSASANITDAWVYVDDIQIGAFQLPARIPVLQRGTHVVKILPGIKQNGIAATRATYPFYAPIEQTIELTEGSTTALGVLKTNYISTTEFDLIEGFEGVTIAIDTTIRSEVALTLTAPGSPLTFEGNHSGEVRIDTVGRLFECTNDQDFLIPFAPVYLEMNFNINNTLVVGLFLYGISVIQQVPVVYLKRTDGEWKKIYIDLTNSLNAYSGMIQFRIFLSAIQETSVVEALILIDNIKVVTRKTN